MPYSGITDEETIKKLDRCVLDVMRTGQDKSSAIAICRHAIGASLEEAEAMLSLKASRGLALEPVTDEEVHALLGADTPVQAGEIMKFRNAVLCRAEINRNNDGITSDGIVELATSLPLMPIDVEHRQDRVIGMFTAARAEPWVRDDGQVVENGALVTDGIIYARRFPEYAEAIVNGDMKLSVECVGKKAVCGKCGTAFASASEYCDHVLKREATRWLFDLSARGGAITDHPAGTDTVFAAEDGFVMIAALADEGPKQRQREPEMEVNDMELEELKATLESVQARVAELESALAAKTAELADVAAKLEASEGKVESMAALPKRAAERALALAAAVGIDEAAKHVERIIGLDEDAWQIVMAMQASIVSQLNALQANTNTNGAQKQVEPSYGVGDDKPAGDNVLFSFKIKED